MAHAPEITLPVRADPRGLAEFARIVAKHMTALADDLERLGGKAGTGTHLLLGYAGERPGPVTACGATLADDPEIRATDGWWDVKCRACIEAAGIRS